VSRAQWVDEPRPDARSWHVPRPLLVFPYFVFGMYGAGKLVGTTVHLSVDADGVSGWPLAPEMDRSWSTIRRARSLRGVVTLPFRQFGTRAGWVPVPERAMAPEQLSEFRGLLASKGLIKADKPESKGKRPPRSTTES
jgi:hypothetical protein